MTDSERLAGPALARVVAITLTLLGLAMALACAGRPTTTDNSNAGPRNDNVNVNVNVSDNDNAGNAPGENTTAGGNNTGVNGNANSGNGNSNAGGPSIDPPEVIWSVQSLADSELREPKWSFREDNADSTRPTHVLRVRFAAEGRSILDTVSSNAQAAVVEGMEYLLSKRIGDSIAAMIKWLEFCGAPAFDQPGSIGALQLTIVEDPAELEAVRTRWPDAATLTFAQANDGWSLATECWRAIAARAPGIPEVLIRGMGPLAPHETTNLNSLGATHLWATCLAIRHKTLVALDDVQRGKPLTGEFAPWQLADFCGYLVSLYSAGAVATAFSADGAANFATQLPRLWQLWVDDRTQLVAADIALDPRLDTAWQLITGHAAAALDSMPATLGSLALRGLQRPVLDGPFGRLALLTQKLAFCGVWLREIVLGPELNIELLRPESPPGPTLLLPLRTVPLPAVLACGLLEVKDAMLAAKLLDRAGLTDQARLVRWLRGVLDDPSDVDLAARLLKWGDTPRGDASLVRFAVALAQRKSGNTQNAAHTAAGLPAGSVEALAWSRLK
ncbi:MAG: hypothetical protein AB7K09_02305 [Planctomycetota bacterium]